MSMFTPVVHGSLKETDTAGFYVDGDGEEGVVFTLPYGQLRFTPEDGEKLAGDILAALGKPSQDVYEVVVAHTVHIRQAVENSSMALQAINRGSASAPAKRYEPELMVVITSLQTILTAVEKIEASR